MNQQEQSGPTTFDAGSGKGSGLYIFMVAFVAALGGFLFGYDLVIISGAQLPLKSHFNLDEGGLAYGMAVSSAGIGCILGPFLGLAFCDYLGRKRTLMLAAALFGASAIGTALPNDIVTFNIFRAVGGLGVGLASVASPMYLVELAPARLRGAMGLMFQLAVCVGALVAVVVAYFIAKYIVSDQTNWRWMFASECVPILAFSCALIFVPFSPRWLAEKGRFDEAMTVLSRVVGADEARSQIDEIKLSLREETGTFSELWRPGLRWALLIGVLLAVFNNWTGWTATAYYLPTLFQKSGVLGTSDAIARSIYVFGGNIILTLIAIWIVDKVGRRPMWNICAIGMILATFLAGLVFQYDIKGVLVVLVIFGTAIPHAIGLGGLPWLMMSELFPTRIRAKAVAITTTVIWTGSFTATLLFPKLVDLSEKSALESPAGVFWLFTIICVFALIFGIVMLPETKNKTLEQIAEQWLKTPDSK